MAAVLTPDPTPRHLPAGAHRSAPAARPQLRLIPGGRSPAALAATYRRRRIVAALVVLTLLVVAVQLAQALAGAAGGWSTPTPTPIEGPTVAVEAAPGDTLWSLAREVHPEGDVRPVVDAMVADRGSATVEVGEQVRVPLDT
ncbi:MAG TPA: hypothetical protein VGO60_00750 [Iamia sp.]|jgi:hypothetical protein|nr:hypothetical protein [Iamia sp.]